MVAAILAACGQSEDPVASSGASNTLLDYVPSDTPYLAANLEPLPDDVIDRATDILKNLEEGEFGESGQPKLAKTRPHKLKSNVSQLDLF